MKEQLETVNGTARRARRLPLSVACPGRKYPGAGLRGSPRLATGLGPRPCGFRQCLTNKKQFSPGPKIENSIALRAENNTYLSCREFLHSVRGGCALQRVGAGDAISAALHTLPRYGTTQPGKVFRAWAIKSVEKFYTCPACLPALRSLALSIACATRHAPCVQSRRGIVWCCTSTFSSQQQRAKGNHEQ